MEPTYGQMREGGQLWAGPKWPSADGTHELPSSEGAFPGATGSALSSEELHEELFNLVEVDQGKGFVPSHEYAPMTAEQFFAHVRAWRTHSRRAADNIDKFLTKYGRQ